jgi:2-hydroxychromene-2-carboxylate isomerase
MGGAHPEQPIFYYDLASPEAYLVAERSAGVLGEVPEWQPVRLAGLRAGEVGPFRCAAEVDAYREDVGRRAAAHGLQPLRWPDPFPADTEWAMLVATYAKQIGRAVAFSLAAFRQAFAAGRDLGDEHTVLIAAAAAEMHPAALLKGITLQSVHDALRQAGARARAAGVASLPAIQVGDALLAGEDLIAQAAQTLGAQG